MIRYTFYFTILILLIINSQENPNNIVSVIVDDIQQEINVTCLCSEDEQCDGNSRTCHLNNSEHVCYQSWSKNIDSNTIQVTSGCIYNEFFITQILCSNNQSDRYIICCSDKNYCNDRDAYSGDIRKQLSGKAKEDKSDRFILKLILFIIGSIILLLILLISFVLLRMNRNTRKKSSTSKDPKNKTKKNRHLSRYACLGSKSSISNVQAPESLEEHSSCSSRCDQLSETNKFIGPFVRPIRFTDQITLEARIGVGAYGCVYRGKWFDETIAVKIFLSSEEPSWGREVEIYQTPGLNHENILRYIAADNTDISNRIELWLATEYHENGSVYDYLMNHTITVPILTKMLYSIVNGLWRLHIPINATNGKVAFAHRDLKTKNILVKKDLTCCIADLGLAVKEERKLQNDKQEDVNINIQPNHRVGTIRYMSPEILDKTINTQSFESYKAADIYALGLVFWEILRRCQTSLKEDDADPYQLPYQDILPSNPSFEQMYEVVGVRKIRPVPSPRWKTHQILNYISTLCEELWDEDPTCRPNSLYIKMQLKKRFESIDNEISNINNESTNQGPQTV